jgi:hypothetical protein
LNIQGAKLAKEDAKGATVKPALSASKPLNGRCLVLQEKIGRVTNSRVRVGFAIYMLNHPPERPAVIGVQNPAAVADLRQTCEELGVRIETLEP